MLSWRYDFFAMGHTMSEIDDMSYWDLIGVSKYKAQNRPTESGETRYKELKPSQKQMIEERKGRMKKQGKK